jgi:hypothetical protein
MGEATECDREPDFSKPRRVGSWAVACDWVGHETRQGPTVEVWRAL